MSLQVIDERESLEGLLHDLERFQGFSLVKGLTLLTRATLGIDGRLSSVETKVDSLEVKVDAGFAAVDLRFEAVDRRFDAMDQRFDAMDRRFDTVETRFDVLSDDVRAIGASMERIVGYIARDERRGSA